MELTFLEEEKLGRRAQRGRRTVNPSHKPIRPVNLSKLLGIYPKAPVTGESSCVLGGCEAGRPACWGAQWHVQGRTRAGVDRPKPAVPLSRSKARVGSLAWQQPYILAESRRPEENPWPSACWVIPAPPRLEAVPLGHSNGCQHLAGGLQAPRNWKRGADWLPSEVAPLAVAALRFLYQPGTRYTDNHKQRGKHLHTRLSRAWDLGNWFGEGKQRQNENCERSVKRNSVKARWEEEAGRWRLRPKCRADTREGSEGRKERWAGLQAALRKSQPRGCRAQGCHSVWAGVAGSAPTPTMSSVIARSSLGRGWLGMHTAMGWKEWQVEAELVTLLTAGRSEQHPSTAT